MIDVVTGMLARTVAARGLPTRPPELTALAYALVGAGESLADWLVDHAEATPDVTAGRLMNIVWLGAAQLLDGTAWHPAVRPSPA